MNTIENAENAVRRLTQIVESLESEGELSIFSDLAEDLKWILDDLDAGVALLQRMAKNEPQLTSRLATLIALVTNEVQLPPGGLLDRLRDELAQNPDRPCPACLRVPVSTSTWNRVAAQDETIRKLREKIVNKKGRPDES